ncbi:hypothetical protein SNEBB_007468 [Seison nebaliae]|nr:hypothetical protein SNEBB_007468 [Seison nebaliae]
MKRITLSWSDIRFFLNLLIIVLALYLAHWNYNRLPSIKEIEEKRIVDFSEKRARRHLETICSFGPKPTGSYNNEKLTYQYLVGELRKLIVLFDDMLEKNENSLELSGSISSNSYQLAFLDSFNSIYDNVQNIAIRLGPLNDTNSKSFLLNVHYDTIVGTVGASDNTVNVAIALELMRTLIYRLPNERMKYSIIFNFNGAEENMLQASHAFITTHKWAKNVVAFVNLEAAGTGGKEVLFQIGPNNSWLFKAFAANCYSPNGNAFAQDLFTTGIIPSDTDFRIFRDFGQLPGLDFAFIRNGYAYHTVNDIPSRIDVGSIQHCGENMLSFFGQIINNRIEPEINVENDEEIFADFLGLTYLHLHISVCRILAVCMVINILLSIGKLRGEFKKFGKKNQMIYEKKTDEPSTIPSFTLQFVRCVILVWISFISMIIIMIFWCLIYTKFLVWPLSYYRFHRVIIIIYLIPLLFVVDGIHLRVRTIYVKKYFNDNYPIFHRFFLRSLQFQFLIFILFTLNFNCKSVYLFSIIVIPSLILTNVGENGLCQSLSILTSIPIVIHISQIAYAFFDMIIPVSGRMGKAILPDLLILFIIIFMFILYSLFILPNWFDGELIGRKIKIFGFILWFSFIVMIIVTKYNSVFPYIRHQLQSNDTFPIKQRSILLYVVRDDFGKIESNSLDTNRSIVNGREKFFWIIPFDYNQLDFIQTHPHFKHNFKKVENCSKKTYCHLPYLVPIAKLVSDSYISNDPIPYMIDENERPKVKYRMLSKQSTLMNVSLEIEQTDHMVVTFGLWGKQTKLVNWSIPCNGCKDGWKPLKSQRPSAFSSEYYIYYSFGQQPKEPLKFSLLFQIPEEEIRPEILVDFSVYSSIVNEAIRMKNEHLVEMQQDMPPFVNSLPWRAHMILFHI